MARYAHPLDSGFMGPSANYLLTQELVLTPKVVRCYEDEMN